MKLPNGAQPRWLNSSLWTVPAVWFLVGCLEPARALHGQESGRATGAFATGDLDEISGMAASRENPGVLWVHDDGDIDSVHAVRESGDLAVQLMLGQTAEDCEDMAIGPGRDGNDYLYLGDIGDNDQQRPTVRVFRVAEPQVPAETPARIDAKVEALTLSYPDGSHDAEALLVDPVSGDLLIVTKEDGRAGLYRAAADAAWDGGPAKLERLASLSVEKVSAGDISRDGRWILLRREEVGWLFARDGGEPIAEALAREPQRVAVRGQTQKKNGEAVAFHPDGDGYFTVSEGKRQPIYRFGLP